MVLIKSDEILKKSIPNVRVLSAMVFDYDALVKTYGLQLLEKGNAEQITFCGSRNSLSVIAVA
ncbi:MAG: hypothetical protein ACI4A7_02715 [Prevotella sp.]